MSEHHLTRSPSSLPAKTECVHFESSEAGDPAKKGSVLHDYFEQILNGVEFKDLKRPVIYPEIEIENDDLENLFWARDELQDIILEMSETRSIEDIVKAGDAHTERKVEIYGECFEPLTFGRMDFDFLNMIVDLKTGMIRNYREQMIAYALAKMQETGEDLIHVAELYSTERKVIRYDLTRAECEGTLFSLCKKIDNKDNYPESPCSYCSWCANNPCKAVFDLTSNLQENRKDLFPQDISFRSTEVLAAAQGALLEYHAEPNDVTQKALETHAATLEFLYASASAAEKYLNGVKNNIKKAIGDGVHIPGLKLQNKSGKTVVSDPNKLFQVSGLDPKEFFKCVDVSLTKFGELMTVEAIFSMYESSNITFPDNLRGKKVAITKAGMPKAIKHLFKELEIADAGAGSVSVVRDKPYSSLRKAVE